MALLRGFDFPEHLWYSTETMIWIAPEPDGLLRVGMSALGLATAGEFLVFTARPVGADITAGKAIGNVETAKTVSSVRTPIAGRIVAINDAVEADGVLISRQPYDAWLVRLAPAFTPGDTVSDDTAAWLSAAGLLTGQAAMNGIAAVLAHYRVGE